MTDVIQKVKAGDINNGSAIVGVDKLGGYKKIDADNDGISTTSIENRYTNRFMLDDGFLPASQYQWTDLPILPSTFDFAGNNDPAIVSWQPGGSGVSFRVWEFEQNDQGFFTSQLPHGYVEGTDLYPHVHWTPKEKGVAESGKTVDWRLDYSITSVNGVFASGKTVLMTDICAGINHRHEICAAVPVISGSGLGISSMIVGRLYRGNNDTWAGTTTGNLPCLLELDIHYQINSYGSRTERAK